MATQDRPALGLDGAGNRASRRVRSSPTRFAPRTAFGLQLTALSGFVDATGAIQLGGLNVSFMSGNTTSLATALVDGQSKEVLAVAAIVATFVAGAVLGARLAATVAPTKLPVSVLLVEAGLMAAALALAGRVPDLVASLPLCCAMVVQNILRDSVAGVEIGRSFVTGTLYQLGQELALPGRPGAPRRASLAAATAASLLAGGASGAAVTLTYGPGTALLVALGIVSALCAWRLIVGPPTCPATRPET